MVTKRLLRAWKKYEKVRAGGKYNMITDWQQACLETGLAEKTYCQVIRRYSVIKDEIILKYGSIEQFMGKKDV